MLHALMLYGIGGEVDGADIVAVDKGGALKGVVELLEKLAHPGSLCHTVDHSVVLILCVGAGDDGLLLSGLGDEVGTQEHGIAQSGLACVGASDPVSVSVDHDLRCRRWSE
jgi:hypothetical protein